MTGSDKANPTDGIIGYVCPVGHYCPEGAVIETTCARGYYSPMTGLGKKQTFVLYTRVDQKVRRKKLPFLHRFINRAGNTAHNTATLMQLMGNIMLDVSRLRTLQLSSRQCYIAHTGPFCFAF